jgi:hypothetical protein
MWLGVSVILPLVWRHPERARFHQRAEGSCVGRVRGQYTRDPSLRLKSGYAQDDAI